MLFRSQSVRFAREHGLPASVRGGGHSVAGAQKNTHTSQFDGLLTVGQFKRVFIDHTDHVAVLDPL